MNDTFLVLARFSCDDIPLRVCDNLHDAKTLALTLASEPELILRDMAESWMLQNSEPDIDALAAVVVLRLLDGAVPTEMVAMAIPDDE